MDIINVVLITRVFKKIYKIRLAHLRNGVSRFGVDVVRTNA